MGEDPLAWSIPLARLGPLRVRAHALLPVWIAAELLAWLPHHAIGLVHVAAAVASLVLIALVREVARAVTARAMGAPVERVVLWPLGGLTAAAEGDVRLTRPVLAEVGGLAAGMALLPVLALAVIASGAPWQALTPNLLAPGVAAGGLRSVPQILAWWLYVANAGVLAANLLLPMAPFDAWRLLRARLAPLGDRGHDLATRIGLLAALAVFIGASTAGHTRLMALAAVAAFATYFDFRRVEFIRETGPTRTPAPPVGPPAPPPPPTLDDLLAKISAEGLGSLSPAEREVLARETERRRREPARPAPPARPT